MSKLGEIIEQLEKTIERLEILKQDVDSDSEERKELNDKTKELCDRRDILIKKLFKEDTQVYIDTTKKISKINKKLQDSIDNIEDLQKTLTNVAKLTAAIDELIKIAAEVRP